ncbi:MAG: zinc-binding alcohol dehydrogenase family protein [Bacteroidales bacterium]|nr:zinc-binding alcohol dehydrogenase family protein [Bacteroidales bacterium]MBQ7071830.1 zinc-binding alcohol dehydrogenase family protein [Bacteroidales bacterium]MBR4001054.1 zinc-binding alcohol dehydrogenase family protein [Bacteroidales bacterium]
MKTLQIVQPGVIRLTDTPEPAPGPGEIKVKIHYAGFCGSDLNTFRGANAMVSYPRIPGHEIGASIEALGSDVPDSFKPGQIVTLNPYTSCGKCASCRRGRPNACENNETLGVQRDGAMKEFICVPWQKVIPCGEVPLKYTALIEPMSVGFHAANRGRITKDDVVMVIGCGMVGLGALVSAVQRGATVIAADIDPVKLELARKLGAAYAYNSSTEWEGLPDPDVVIEAVGSVPTYRMAVERVAFTGRIVCIGYAKTDVSLPTSLFVKKELDIMGSRNATPEDFSDVISYLSSGVDADAFVSDIIDPKDAQDAMEKWNANPGKVFRILTKWAI